MLIVLHPFWWRLINWDFNFNCSFWSQLAGKSCSGNPIMHASQDTFRFPPFPCKEWKLFFPFWARVKSGPLRFWSASISPSGLASDGFDMKRITSLKRAILFALTLFEVSINCHAKSLGNSHYEVKWDFPENLYLRPRICQGRAANELRLLHHFTRKELGRRKGNETENKRR